MSKVNQIQAKLRSIDGGRFQKLCDLYLIQHPRYAGLRSIGSVVGKDKTKTGVPDSVIALADGTFALAHYTTMDSGLFSKLKQDYASSFVDSETGIPVEQISEVVFCHNGSLGLKEEIALVDQGRERSVMVTFFGLERISYDLFNKYHHLAAELGVDVDTRQILRPADFVTEYNKSAFSARLDTEFHFRAAEIGRALDALKESDLLLITGSPGVGKSRLMLEIANRFTQRDSSFSAWCIFRRGADFFQDLRTYFSVPGNYLVLVDDASRHTLSGLEHILQLLHDRSDDCRVKIVATVRDYAKEKIAKRAAAYGGYSEIQLQPFEDGQIWGLVEGATVIRNPVYLRRIRDLAQGNPRLAIMAARIAIEKNSLESISDVTSLYDEYFGSVCEDLAGLRDVDAVKVAGIISFFRTVDKSNQEQMALIARGFDIHPSRFWETVEQLHDVEVLDLQDEEIARFSDQVLATYLFYLAVFKQEVLDISVFLDNFFPLYRSHFIDVLNPIINALGAGIEKELRPHIQRKREEFRESGDTRNFVDLVRTFWFVDETRTLLDIRDEIWALPFEIIDPHALDLSKEWKDQSSLLPLLDLLGNFRHPNSTIALDLAFEAFSRQPSATVGTVLHVLVRDLGFTHFSYAKDFFYQREVIERLWERTNEGRLMLFSRLFIVVAGSYLQTQYQITEAKGHDAFAIIRFDLPATPSIRDIRQLILGRLFQLYSYPVLHADIIRILDLYCHSGYQISGKEIVQWDAEVIIPFLVSSLDPGKYAHVDVVQSYLGLLRREGVEYDGGVLEHFRNEMSDIADLLLIDRVTRTGRKWQEAQLWQDNRLSEYLKSFDAEGYEDFFRQCLTIERETHRQRETWQVRRSLEKVLIILREGDSELFVSVLSRYLDMGNPFEIVDSRLVSRLIEVCGAEYAYNIINGKEFQRKAQWLFSFYRVLPPEQVRQEHLVEVYELYRISPPAEISLSFDSLERYLRFDNRFILRILELLLARMEREADPDLVSRFSLVLDLSTLATEKLLLYFGGENMGMVKRVYLAGEQARDHSDDDGLLFGFILDFDCGFLCEYIDFIVDRALRSNRLWLSKKDYRREYGFLWMRNDYEEIIVLATEHLFSLREGLQFYINDLLEEIFAVEIRGEVSEIEERRKSLLGHLVKLRAKDRDFIHFIFEVVRGLPCAERRFLVALFLEHNQRIGDFKGLPLDARDSMGFGSAVPMFQEQVCFLESLLPLVQRIDLLDHRAYLEERIQRLQRTIESEKKRDMLGD